MAQRAGAAPAHTRSQLQLPFAASLSKGKSTERIKQPRTWALGPYRASLWLQSICIHPLQPGAGLPQEAGGEEDEDASSPTPQSCSGAAQMQNSHCRPWDAEKLIAEIPSMLRLLPGIRTWHKEPVQITHSHNKPTPPHPELQNPHPWVLFAKRAKAPAISRAPCCRLSRSAVKLVSVVHGIGCCQQRKGGTVGESRTNTV